MNNYAIARVFSRIADLMEIQGENVFKIRSYRNAAQTMQELTESLEVLAERGALQTIPGVGEAIASKTREILATGTCALYEQLKEEVPESLAELLNLPGFGPKKILAVWQQLGVRSLADLERAAREGRLRPLAGFTAKTEAAVLENIEGVRRRRARTPIGVALPYAEALREMLLATGKFRRLEIAGSLRRMKDTAGDIDLVGTAPEEAAALEAAAAHGEVREVLLRTADEICFLTESGRRVELRLAPEARFGAVLQRVTGSEEHNRQLAMLAGERGCASGAPGAEEEEVYRAAGLPCIPPELREGRGEIEAAREGRLPRLIEVSDIRGVLHAHSTWSDGAASVAQMAEAARRLGHAYLAITDHSQALTVAGGLNEERLAAQAAEIDALNAGFTDGFRVLKGIECDILMDGALDLSPAALQTLDFVIGSVHAHQKLEREAQTARIVRALESGLIDLLAHPTGRILGMRDSYAVDLERVMDAALAHGVALEINAYPDRLDLEDVHARRAKERGIAISVNPDAHRPDHLALLRYGIAQARRAWLEPDDVINTWPLDRLLAWLVKRR
jgi:DNA polymerase (family X)